MELVRTHLRDVEGGQWGTSGKVSEGCCPQGRTQETRPEDAPLLLQLNVGDSAACEGG